MGLPSSCVPQSTPVCSSTPESTPLPRLEILKPLAAAPIDGAAAFHVHGTDPQHLLLDACFLGPYAENDGLLKKLVVEFLRDHVYDHGQR
jgi:hypothetical protein